MATRKAAFILPFVLLAGCQASGVSAIDECIATYAVPAGTKKGVTYAAGMCRQLFEAGVSPKRKNYIACALPVLANARTDLGRNAGVQQCHRKFFGDAEYSSAAAPAQQPGPWTEYEHSEPVQARELTPEGLTEVEPDEQHVESAEPATR